LLFLKVADQPRFEPRIGLAVTNTFASTKGDFSDAIAAIAAPTN
jgi:hypothetical protein